MCVYVCVHVCMYVTCVHSYMLVSNIFFECTSAAWLRRASSCTGLRLWFARYWFTSCSIYSRSWSLIVAEHMKVMDTKQSIVTRVYVVSLVIMKEWLYQNRPKRDYEMNDEVDRDINVMALLLPRARATTGDDCLSGWEYKWNPMWREIKRNEPWSEQEKDRLKPPRIRIFSRSQDSRVEALSVDDHLSADVVHQTRGDSEPWAHRMTGMSSVQDRWWFQFATATAAGCSTAYLFTIPMYSN